MRQYQRIDATHARASQERHDDALADFLGGRSRAASAFQAPAGIHQNRVARGRLNNDAVRLSDVEYGYSQTRVGAQRRSQHERERDKGDGERGRAGMLPPEPHAGNERGIVSGYRPSVRRRNRKRGMGKRRQRVYHGNDPR